MQKPAVMGILNCGPNSFYDGGKYLTPQSALERANVMLEEGADFIDIGAVSTRPSSSLVGAEREIPLLLPVLKAVKKACPKAQLSVDTYNYQTARECLENGALILNDVSALKDERFLSLAKEYKARLVIMHARGTPKTMQDLCVYDDILKEIYAFFTEKIKLAAAAGLSKEQVILDIGLGFAKTREQNWFLLENIAYFKTLGTTLLAGASRKSFTDKTLELSLKSAKLAARGGADILRVHDVKETVSCLEKIYEPA